MAGLVAGLGYLVVSSADSWGDWVVFGVVDADAFGARWPCTIASTRRASGRSAAPPTTAAAVRRGSAVRARRWLIASTAAWICGICDRCRGSCRESSRALHRGDRLDRRCAIVLDQRHLAEELAGPELGDRASPCAAPPRFRRGSRRTRWPKSPSRASTEPAPTSSSSICCATVARSLFDRPLKKGTSFERPLEHLAVPLVRSAAEVTPPRSPTEPLGETSASPSDRAVRRTPRN